MEVRNIFRACLLLVSLTLLSCVSLVSADDGQPLRSRDRSTPEQQRRFHKFVTRPDIDAPIWNVKTHNAKALSPGYWFVSFYKGLDQYEPGESWLGPHIYNDKGELVWAGGSAFKHWNIFDFGTYDEGNGQEQLTLLSNHEQAAYILDNTYHVQKKVPLVIDEETKPNMHSFHVIDGGKKALILNLRPIDMTAEETLQQIGYNGTCDAKFQGFRELDLESPESRPLFEWDAKDHITLDESTYRQYKGSVREMCMKGWDILHFNSIDKFPDGDYLLSSRHTDTLYKISHVDGSIVWRLGGVKSDFEFVGEARFSRQHHGRVLSQNETHSVITLFDNAVGDGFEEKPSHSESRGLVLSVETQAMKARTLAEYPHPRSTRTNARGSFQILPNSNAFVCWAYSSRISEHTTEGKLAMEAWLEVPTHTYRAFKYPWIGRPSQPPDIIAETYWDRNRIKTVVHASWNGATDVAEWRLNSINDEGDAEIIKTARRTGFETAIKFDGYATDIFAEAFDSHGNSLGKSDVVLTPPPLEMGVDAFEAAYHPPSAEIPGIHLVPDLEVHYSVAHLETSPADSSSLESSKSAHNPVLTFLFGVAVMSVLISLYVWRWSKSRKGTGWQMHEQKSPRPSKRKKHERYMSVSSAVEI